MDVYIATIEDTGAGRVFELRALGGKPLPHYEAGAHLDLTLGNGMTRQYSLCCAAPSPHTYRIAVKREPASRGGSDWLHDQARVGTTLQVSAPRNAFALALDASEHLLFAGGIGITPILSMGYELLRRGQPFRLAYFVRNSAAVMFADELRGGPLAPYVSMAVGLGPEESSAQIRALLDSARTAGTHAYVCGPPGFMDSVVKEAKLRLGEQYVHKESFSAPPPAEGDREFVLQLARSQRQIRVPADMTALACLQEAGIDIDCSCEVGVCGTCRMAVLNGVPDHRDGFLTPAERAENRAFMPCVSRAMTPVLDIDL